MVCPATDQSAEQNRSVVASAIATDMPELARRIAELPRGDTFRVVLSQPVGGGLNLRPDGDFDAFVKNPEGTIKAVARLKRVQPAVLTSITMLAGQAMLAKISQQIAKLHVDIETLLRLQVAGELGKVKAAVTTLRTIHYYRGGHRDQVLLSTTAALKEAIGVATQQAVELIRSVPEPPRYNMHRAVWDSSPDTVKALQRARDAVVVVLFGLQALGEAEVLLNENTAAAEIMRAWIEEARRNLDFARCEHLARMIPANKREDRHEIFWMTAASTIGNMHQHISGLIAGDDPLRISFECKSGDPVAANDPA